MKAYAVVDRTGDVVTVCGSRLAIYPFVPESLDVVKFEAEADKEYRVAIVTIQLVPHGIIINSSTKGETNV